MKIQDYLECVALQLGRKNILLEHRFFEDLEAESIDMVYLIATIEEKTGLFIPEEELSSFITVQELYDYILTHQ